LFIPNPDPKFLTVLDSGVKKAPDPGSGSATLPSPVFSDTGSRSGPKTGFYPWTSY
jgi:hypothetical protein